MTTTLSFASDAFEPVYGWFEDHAGVAVEVWGLEYDRPVALIAYCDGAEDEFGWADWVSAANEDPSDICGFFERLQIVAEDGVAAQLAAAFPGVFTADAAS
ncbi:MAG TPA: hypothetical protein VMU37_09425 [Caulobacteraceae bacterium]|nr:hypothetical protein [Caulobacteraceae bacterium]